MKSIRCDDIDLACVDTGPPAGGGPTLLLVHGFPLSHAMWASQVDALRGVCRVVAPDLRGHGASPQGEWPGGEAPSLARHADDLAALLDGLGVNGPTIYCGFSMGGYIAWPFLERHGERLTGLSLIDTRAAADDDVARATRLKMAEGVAAWGAARVAELMRPKLFGPEADSSVVDATTAVIAATAPRSIAASQRAMAARPDATPRLPHIDLPTLVVCGEHDAISTAAEMRGIAAAIPEARYAEIAGAGHMAPLERPAEVNAALRSFVAEIA